jgi:hypothetical protein
MNWPMKELLGYHDAAGPPAEHLPTRFSDQMPCRRAGADRDRVKKPRKLVNSGTL